MTPLLDLLQLAPYEWLRLPYGQDKSIASKCHKYEKNNKIGLNLQFGSFCPLLLQQLGILTYLRFILYRMLQWQMNFENVTFSDNLLSYERRHFIPYIDIFFKKTNFLGGSKNKVYLLKINNMIYLNHVHIAIFLAGDSWFQLICTTYFYPHWNWKPNLIGNEGKKENFLLCSATWFIMLVFL